MTGDSTPPHQRRLAGDEPLPLILPSDADIKRRFGPEIAEGWIGTKTDALRRAMLRTLIQKEKHDEGHTGGARPIEVRTPGAAFLQHEIERLQRAQMIDTTYAIVPAFAFAVEQNKTKYVKEIERAEAELATYAEGDSHQNDLVHRVAMRSLQSHMLDMLLEGNGLEYDAFLKRIDADSRCATFDRQTLLDEYLHYLGVLLHRKQITNHQLPRG